MPTRTDVQTDVHIEPVDSDSPIRNLLQSTNSEMCICAVVRQLVRPRATFP